METLVAKYPQVSDDQLSLAKNHNGLGLSLVNQQKAAAAEREYRNAIRVFKKLVEVSPGINEYPIMLAASCCNLGLLLRDNGQPQKSLGPFQTAIDSLLPLNKKDPQHAQVILFLRNSYWGRAGAYHSLGQFDEAVKDWDRTSEYAQPNYHTMFRILKNLSVVHTDNADKAVADTDALRDLPLRGSGELYQFARVYSVAATKIAAKKAEYTDRAIEMLQKAIEAGFKDVDRLKSEADLKPLRETKEFRQLVEGLQAKFPAREVSPLPRAVQ